MTDIICPICGKPNPPDQEECRYCQAPLKSSGFISPSTSQGGEDSLFPPQNEAAGDNPQPEKNEAASSPLEEAIPEWLKQTESNFLEPSKTGPLNPEPEDLGPDQVSEQIDSLLNQPSSSPDERVASIDDDWLASLLEEAGLSEPSSLSTPGEQQAGQGDEAEAEDHEPSEEESPEVTPEEESLPPLEPAEKPDWLSELEAGSKIKIDGAITPAETGEIVGEEPEAAEPESSEEVAVPDWVGKPSPEEVLPESKEPEGTIAPAELPSWLEALRPNEEVAPTEPVEDLSAADIVTAGPLVGLRGVISAHPSAIRARKPPTYSIKLRVTDEQRSRVEMMEELLATEQKPKPLPSKPIITSRNITRLIIALVLILPIVWMVITGSQRIPPPQPGNIPGVVDFTQQVQKLPSGAPVLLAFDYEAGFSGEMNTAISTLVSQLMVKNAFMTLVTTSPSGPALAESMINSVTSKQGTPYSYYTDLGFIPGGTLGLLGLATSPKTVLPYSLDGINIWAGAPLNTISTVADFSAVIVLANDSATTRAWIEQVGPFLKDTGTPLLIITSTQAEPLILPYYLGTPSQVQGLVTGLVGGWAYARTVGIIQQNGSWDAFSIGITVSVFVILVGSIIGMVIKMRAPESRKGS